MITGSVDGPSVLSHLGFSHITWGLSWSGEWSTIGQFTNVHSTSGGWPARDVDVFRKRSERCCGRTGREGETPTEGHDLVVEVGHEQIVVTEPHDHVPVIGSRVQHDHRRLVRAAWSGLW
jgi:hypothetical protein